MSDDEPPSKRARRAERLQSAASLQTRSPFDAVTFAQPAVEQTLLNLAFDDAVAFCSSTPRVHAICSQVSFWRAWLQRRPLRTNDWRLRSDQDASLDSALDRASTQNDASLDPRRFMYLLKVVQTLPPDTRASVFDDYRLELLRQSHELQGADDARRSVVERKWRHFFDALRENGLPLHKLSGSWLAETLVAVRHLSEPIMRALVALPNAYADNTLTPEEVVCKKEALVDILFNREVTLANEYGVDEEMTPLEEAVALGDARLAKALLEQILREYERIATAPGVAPYRRDRVRQLQRNAIHELYERTRPLQDDDSEELEALYEDALTEQQLDAIVQDVFPQYFPN